MTRHTIPSHRLAAQGQPEVVAAAPQENPNRAEQVETLVKVLPSGFKPYPKDVRLYYHPYFWDEITYFTESQVTTSDMYLRILEGITAVGMDRMDLTLQDFEFIAFNRKLASLGTDGFIVSYRHAGVVQSNTVAPTDVEWADLDVPGLPAHIHVVHRERVDGNVVVHGDVELVLSPLTVGNYLMLLERGLAGDPKAIMAAQVRNHDFDTALNIVRLTVESEMRVLDQIDKLFDHGLLPVKVKAKVMDPNPDYDHEDPDSNRFLERTEEVSVPLDDASTLIFPASGEERSYRDLISFGV